MGKFLNHFEREWNILGKSKDEEHSDGKVYKAVSEFLSNLEENEFSDEWVTEASKILDSVTSGKPLSPLTDDPKEWDYVGVDSEYKTNNRYPNLIMHEDGKVQDMKRIVYQDEDGKRFTNANSTGDVKLPYTPGYELRTIDGELISAAR